MTRNQKILLYVGGGTLVALTVAWLIYRSRKGGNNDTECDVTFPIMRGAGGSGATLCETEAVKNIQRYLNTRRVPQLVVDGIFGTNTEAALLEVTGKVSVTANEYEAIVNQLEIYT